MITAKGLTFCDIDSITTLVIAMRRCDQWSPKIVIFGHVGIAGDADCNENNGCKISHGLFGFR